MNVKRCLFAKLCLFACYVLSGTHLLDARLSGTLGRVFEGKPSMARTMGKLLTRRGDWIRTACVKYNGFATSGPILLVTVVLGAYGLIYISGVSV